MIDISKKDKAEVLAALYNNSQPLGMGILHYTPEDMSKSDAEGLLTQDTYFDYLRGRVMKVELGGNELSPALYDRDNGKGAAKSIIESLPDVA